MNTDEFNKVNELDYEGKNEEAYALLCSLADRNDPLALFELSCRNFSSEGQWSEVLKIKNYFEKSKILAESGMTALIRLAENRDGEAMRMIAYAYFSYLGPPHFKDISKAEEWLLKAIKADCHFASNNLATFYQDSNIEEAKKWYSYAEEHGCRVIHNPELET